MSIASENKIVAVIGGAGHTGRFVVAELKRRGLGVIVVGRDQQKLAAEAASPGITVRAAGMDDPTSLDDALSGAAAVINCAGPFMDTAIPVIDAALRAGIPYLDVTAEQQTVQAIIATRDAAARQAGIVLLPAAAFYGGLADLLAGAVHDGSGPVDEVTVAMFLDSWHPTSGTRVTGQRNTAKRLMQRQGRLEVIPDPAPTRHWSFPAPFGDQDMVMLPLTEMITLAHHLRPETIDSWINLAPLRDLRDPATPPPQPSDAQGRSAQLFAMDVLVRTGDRVRRATASGQDIYAITAPIIVEAVERLLAGEAWDKAGTRTLGDVFDARAFLDALGPDTLRVVYQDAA
ncbi:saccharopine dehydrogenase family protein [Sphingomonas alpina]|uniref:Saccharopine dehydrogenase NADP-binding domain-containing protein n=1 Tax=Sphingomonas alpina TaxID=653931 RepID=A0A7H0LLR0_9SPHN|nr:saccharopine dehydrogenase NADP-binding domain-containing protein [Sphingomonas alpina]QNQ10613.1 saccharopine dehydrogenase NADP-binding domain-containing protein [Sphingomonas alpina]